MDKYKIYIVNHMPTKKRFWCFLEPPAPLANEKVFANSSTFVDVESHYEGVSSFTIPVQYVVKAGAGNEAVGLNVVIDTLLPMDVGLTETWEAQYMPPQQGPNLKKSEKKVGPTKIGITTNEFNKEEWARKSWYTNLTFGIKTAQGFIGTTWSPDPGEELTLEPQLIFYIATGTYEKNQLADMSIVSKTSAKVLVPTSFGGSGNNECTVIRTEKGDWDYIKGPPPSLLLASAQQDQEDELVSVNWDLAQLGNGEIHQTFLSGTLAVKTVLRASFVYFVLSSTNFSIKGETKDGTKVRFEYRCDKGADQIKSLFKAGAKLIFKDGKADLASETAGARLLAGSAAALTS